METFIFKTINRMKSKEPPGAWGKLNIWHSNQSLTSSSSLLDKHKPNHTPWFNYYQELY